MRLSRWSCFIHGPNVLQLSKSSATWVCALGRFFGSRSEQTNVIERQKHALCFRSKKSTMSSLLSLLIQQFSISGIEYIQLLRELLVLYNICDVSCLMLKGCIGCYIAESATPFTMTVLKRQGFKFENSITDFMVWCLQKRPMNF